MIKPREFVTRHSFRPELTQEIISRKQRPHGWNLSSEQGQNDMSRLICFGFAAIALTMSLVFSGCCSRNNNSGYGCVGCGFLDQFMQEQVACMQEKIWAKRAFHLRFGHCERVHADHFRAGFVAGYCDVCDGKGGQIPTLPPEKYWGFNYRNQDGAAMQQAWFAGFESGAESAKTDGSGSYKGIQIPRQVQEAITQAEEFENSYNGVRKAVVVDMTPATIPSGMENNSGLPFGPGQEFLTQPNIPVISGNDARLNNAPITNLPSSVTTPGIPAGYDVQTPMPLQPMPLVPAPTR